VGTNHIYGTAEASIWVGYDKSQHTADKLLLNGYGQGHMTHFQFCSPQCYLWNG